MQIVGQAEGFHVSVDGTSLPLAELRIKLLEPHGEKTLRFGPVWMNPGSYSYTATVDNRREVVESEEGNNRTYTWINVEDPSPPAIRDRRGTLGPDLKRPLKKPTIWVTGPTLGGCY